MVNYAESNIYKLCCKDILITDIYIGSTTNMRVRKNQHKSSCNNEKSSHYNCYVYQFIRGNGGFDNFDMVEIEQFNAKDKKDLHKRERHWIEIFKSTLNIVIPTRTKKEYYEDNKEQLIEKSKRYSENNIEKVKANRKEYYEDNKEQLIEKSKIYYDNNTEKVKEYKKKYSELNKDKIKDYFHKNKQKINDKRNQTNNLNKELYTEKRKMNRKKHKKQISEYDKQYREKNKEKINEQCRIRYQLKKQS
jgi:hypothetical protein